MAGSRGPGGGDGSGGDDRRGGKGRGAGPRRPDDSSRGRDDRDRRTPRDGQGAGERSGAPREASTVGRGWGAAPRAETIPASRLPHGGRDAREGGDDRARRESRRDETRRRDRPGAPRRELAEDLPPRDEVIVDDDWIPDEAGLDARERPRPGARRERLRDGRPAPRPAKPPKRRDPQPDPEPETQPEAATSPARPAPQPVEPADPAAAAALADLRAAAEPARAAGMAAYHKTDRPVLGVANPAINDLAKGWRAELEAEADPLAARLAMAAGLWESEVFEARIAAAKLLTQARIRPDDAVWAQILDWVPDFDGWAIADAVASAAERRVMADPARLADLAPLAAGDDLWARRAALVFTLGLAKVNNPSPAEAEARETVLGWAADMAGDPRWFIQKAIGWWLRVLSKREPERVRDFIDTHGAAMKPFARKEALRLIDGGPNDDSEED